MLDPIVCQQCAKAYALLFSFFWAAWCPEWLKKFFFCCHSKHILRHNLLSTFGRGLWSTVQTTRRAPAVQVSTFNFTGINLIIKSRLCQVCLGRGAYFLGKSTDRALGRGIFVSKGLLEQRGKIKNFFAIFLNCNRLSTRF